MNPKYEKLVKILENALDDIKNTLEYMEDAQVEIGVFHLEEQRELCGLLSDKCDYFSASKLSLKSIIEVLKSNGG